jgi:hypothetical protein
MVTPPAPSLDTIAIASAIASADLAEAIATIQVAVASCERVAGVVIAAGTPVNTIVVAHPHPLAGLPFSAAGVSAPVGLVVSAVGPLAAAAVVGALTGIVVGATNPLAAAAAVGTLASTTVSAAAGRPSTRLWVKLGIGRPSSTRTWADLCTGQRNTPSSWHPSTAFWCNRWDPCSRLLWHPCFRHSSRRPRHRGLGSGIRSPSSVMVLSCPAPPTTTHHTLVTSTHLGLLGLLTLPPSLSVMVLSCPSPQ